ncbi:MAG TPA: AmmeMemoRadiSam system radical SAM enzyme [Anaerolineae bacterium]|nr:AmmeMemoRadiSam system radical SAM enzyme [Anaerolineae bacterium]
MHEAMLFDRLEGDRVQCHLCSHRCTIASGHKGICQVRENRDGTLYSLVYGIPLTQAVDPVEKKPLFHFHPGTSAFSIATAGCNFRCAFCQNADISQMPRNKGLIQGRAVPPEQVVEAAARYQCSSIAFTYSEPTIFFEYSYDIARLGHSTGLASIYVTNGYMTREMLDLFSGAGRTEGFLDAANVDLKAFRDETYRSVCGAELQPVLDSLKRMKELGIWVEVTTLVVPGLNDSDAELRDLARFVAEDLGVETPWHVSRFHPEYEMQDRPPTPERTLRRAHELGREAGLRYIYVGNLPGAQLEDTLCPNCGAAVLRRQGFRVVGRALMHGLCAQCSTAIDGVCL